MAQGQPDASQDLAEAFAGTKPVEERLAFDVARLEAYMADVIERFAGPLEVVQFKGGQSNPTYRLTAADRTGYVLRRKPPGELLPSAHAVDREYRVITALADTGVPVPRTDALCTDESIVGTWFYLMEYVEGRIFWTGTLPGVEPDERAALYDAMNETLARLHQVDYQAVGLGDFGKPGAYIARQIHRWTKQYRASETERIDEMERLIEWLPAHIPEPDETSVVHGDYSFQNMIFHPTEPRVVAILDWELSTLGHPLGDFTYHLMPWRLPSSLVRGIADNDLAALGIPSEADYVAAYCRRTGRDGIPDLDFYMAYNMFRMSAILQGIMGRVLSGTAASPHARRMGAMASDLAEAAVAQVPELQ